jgi:hypothetical protein
MEYANAMDNFDNAQPNTSPNTWSPSDPSESKVRSFVGFVGVPSGMAGTLRIRDIEEINKIKEDFSVLQATVQEMPAARWPYLCKILSRCGSLQLFVLSGSIPRGPIFLFASPAEAILFAEHAPRFLRQFAMDAARASQDVYLQELRPHAVGSNVLIEFEYSCTDNVDRHVVTTATQTLCYLFLQTDCAKELGVQGLVVTDEVKSERKALIGKLEELREMRALPWESLRCSGECLYAVWRAIGEMRVRDGQWDSNFDPAAVVTILPACRHDAKNVADFALNHLAMDSRWEKKQLKLSLLLLSTPDLATRHKRHSWSC